MPPPSSSRHHPPRAPALYMPLPLLYRIAHANLPHSTAYLSNGEGIFEADDATAISAKKSASGEVVMADVDGDG